MMGTLNFILIVALLPIAVFGLEESEVRENTCKKIDPHMDQEPLNIDMSWMNSVEQWYVPMWSKLYAYRIASAILEEDMAKISKDRLGKSCILMKQNVVSAYGKEAVFDMENDGSTLVFKAPWKKAKSGKFSFKLTDNTSYIFGVTCWEDDQISWAVLSTTPTLRPSVKALIMDYIKALGLKWAMTLEEDYGYGSCKGAKVSKVNSEDKLDKEEL